MPHNPAGDQAQPSSPHAADTRWRSPGSLAIGTASLLADAGHEIPTSLLPGFLTATLAPRRPRSGSSKASPTAWRARRGWLAARSPTTRCDAAASPLAATRRPRCCRRGSARPARDPGGSPSAGRVGGAGPAGSGAQRAARRRRASGRLWAGVRLRASDGQPRRHRRTAARPRARQRGRGPHRNGRVGGARTARRGGCGSGRCSRARCGAWRPGSACSRSATSPRPC